MAHGATAAVGTLGGYSILYNLLGLPAGVVPVTKVRAGEPWDGGPTLDRALRARAAEEAGSVGLPIVVQVAARSGADALVLAALRAIEVAARAAGSHPGVPAPPPSPGPCRMALDDSSR